jgi:hypothetical protein
MKKLLILLVLGLTILLFLSFIPSNTIVDNNVLGNGDSYAISVPAKPPKPPQK